VSGPGFRSIARAGEEIVLIVDDTPLGMARGRSLLAGLLLAGRAGAAADFFCAIGQCQRCLVTVDGRVAAACMTYPSGGERVSTLAVDGRPPPWS
jgi:aerobic-type carbon monoxide dehydrogenase small subunit (CoxS/CutS family)